jgi:hypothetical protein
LEEASDDHFGMELSLSYTICLLHLSFRLLNLSLTKNI